MGLEQHRRSMDHSYKSAALIKVDKLLRGYEDPKNLSPRSFRGSYVRWQDDWDSFNTPVAVSIGVGVVAGLTNVAVETARNGVNAIGSYAQELGDYDDQRMIDGMRESVAKAKGWLKNEVQMARDLRRHMK